MGTDNARGALASLLGGRLAAIPPERRRRRRVVAIDPSRPSRVLVDGHACINFCSNDYLGLSAHPEVIEAGCLAAARLGAGSGASHLVSGHGPEHEALEAELAAFTGRERALVFSTGYMANLGIASALIGRSDAVFEDRLNHASLLDAGLASGARFARYAHCDVAALDGHLRKGPPTPQWVLTDGVFSMDGDIAPLDALARTAADRGAFLVVDDAHGFGVLGAQGRGSVVAAGLDADDVPVLMGTLGKACGTFGAFVAGRAELIELLIQKARTYIYTTALPPGVAASTRAALGILATDEGRRERLRAHIARFRARAEDRGWPVLPSSTPIQPLVLGAEAAALEASERLLAAGILVSAIRPPTVPAGTARLRITFTAAHEDDDIDRLLAALDSLRLPERRP